MRGAPEPRGPPRTEATVILGITANKNYRPPEKPEARIIERKSNGVSPVKIGEAVAAEPEDDGQSWH